MVFAVAEKAAGDHHRCNGRCWDACVPAQRVMMPVQIGRCSPSEGTFNVSFPTHAIFLLFAIANRIVKLLVELGDDKHS